MVNTTATFSLPGEYIIRIEGNDSSGVGGGGFQCCWTTAYLKVNVKAANTGGSNATRRQPRSFRSFQTPRSITRWVAAFARTLTMTAEVVPVADRFRCAIHDSIEPHFLVWLPPAIASATGHRDSRSWGFTCQFRAASRSASFTVILAVWVSVSGVAPCPGTFGYARHGCRLLRRRPARRPNRHHQPGHRHLPRGDQQRRRQLVRAGPDARRLPGVGGADRIQAIPAARSAGDRRHDDHGAGDAGARRARGDHYRHERGAAHRRDVEADRRQHRHQGPDAAAEHLAQLARLRRPAAGRHPGAEPGVVGIGDDLGQRRRLAQQLVPGRRRLGQRRLPGPEQRRPGARADRGRAGIADPHRAVRRRVRPDLRRDRQRGDQVGHQPAARRRRSSSTRTRRCAPRTSS